MQDVRKRAIQRATQATSWGVVLGTLGRQGNPRIMDHLVNVLTSKGLTYCVVLLSEVSPAKLARFEGVQAWVQIACPRLSIDWGEGFALPTLTPYEVRGWEGVSGRGRGDEGCVCIASVVCVGSGGHS